MTTDLQLNAEALTSVAELTHYAQYLMDSKMIPSNFKTPEEVVTVILKGKEVGLPSLSALENIYYIQGRPTMGINAMLALATKVGIAITTIKDYTPVYTPVVDADGNVVLDDKGEPKRKFTDYETVIRVYRKFPELDGKILETDVTFTYSEASSMGLLTKDNWKKQLKNMMWVRCASRALRRFAADALLGIYETSEILDGTDTPYTVDAEYNVVI